MERIGGDHDGVDFTAQDEAVEKRLRLGREVGAVERRDEEGAYRQLPPGEFLLDEGALGGNVERAGDCDIAVRLRAAEEFGKMEVRGVWAAADDEYLDHAGVGDRVENRKGLTSFMGIGFLHQCSGFCWRTQFAFR